MSRTKRLKGVKGGDTMVVIDGQVVKFVGLFEYVGLHFQKRLG